MRGNDQNEEEGNGRALDTYFASIWFVIFDRSMGLASSVHAVSHVLATESLLVGDSEN